MTPDAVSLMVPIVSTLIAGWFAYLAKKAHNRSPETVAGGYASLVSDLRLELERLAERVQHLEAERRVLSSNVNDLTNQLQWLLINVTEDDRVQFNAKFKKNN